MRSETALLILAALAIGLTTVGCERSKPAAPPAPREAPELKPAPQPTTQPAETTPGAEVAPPAEPVAWQSGKPYLCHRAAAPIPIDEAPHPQAWAGAMVIKDFKLPAALTPATSRTEAMLLWDDEYLYVQMIAYDRDLKAKYTKRTDPLWNEDVVELFLKPWADKPPYYEFEVNPLGTVMALAIPQRKGRKGVEAESKWAHGIKSAVQVVGTLNDPSDLDNQFRVVMAIPWKRLALAGGKPPRAGDAWKFTVCRYDYSKYLPNTKEEQTSAPLTDESFHHYEDYSEIQFVK